MKKENYVYSVLNNKAAFLFLKFGSLPIAFASENPTAISEFIPKSIEVKDNGCVLKAEAGGWYYQPFKEDQEPATGGPWTIPNGIRSTPARSQSP